MIVCVEVFEDFMMCLFVLMLLKIFGDLFVGDFDFGFMVRVDFCDEFYG